MSMWIPLIQATPALVRAGVALSREVRQKRAAPKRAPRKRASVKSSSRPQLDAEQLEAVRIIAQEVERAPLPPMLASSRPALTIAMVVNAWHESRLRPGAHNQRGEDSVGLFQINRRAHPGHSVEQLKNPAYNARYALELVRRQGKRFEQALARGATVAQLTGGFTYLVERPKDRAQKAMERAQTAREWFGKAALARSWGWKGGS